jgi:hypothetical protein
VYLDVLDFDDPPSTITGILSIEPTRTTEVGLPLPYPGVGEGGPTAKKNTWTFRVPIDERAELGVHMDHLAHLIESAADRFREVGGFAQLRVTIDIDYDVDSSVALSDLSIHGMELSPYTLKVLGSIGATLVIDVDV